MKKIIKVFALALLAGTFAGCTDTDDSPAPVKTRTPNGNDGNKPAGTGGAGGGTPTVNPATPVKAPVAGAVPTALVGTWTYYRVVIVDKNNQVQPMAAQGTLAIAAEGTFTSDLTVGTQNLKEQGSCTATDTTVHTVGAEGAADFIYQVGEDQLQDGTKVKTLVLQQNLADGTKQVFYTYHKL